jgi:hypothetical protein
MLVGKGWAHVCAVLYMIYPNPYNTDIFHSSSSLNNHEDTPLFYTYILFKPNLLSMMRKFTLEEAKHISQSLQSKKSSQYTKIYIS